MKDKTIITFSRRTDGGIYVDWLIDKLKKGYCYYPNPFTQKPIRQGLTNDDVYFLSLWTKAPHMLLDRLSELLTFILLNFQVSLTGYGRIVEYNVPEAKITIDAIKIISDRIKNPSLINWRYDTILFSKIFSMDWHLNNFSILCRNLSGYVDRVIISQIQLEKSYSIIKNRLECNAKKYNDNMFYPNKKEFLEFADKLSTIAKESKIKLQICCQPNINPKTDNLLIKKYSSLYNGCISDELVNNIIPGLSLRKGNGQRPQCLCKITRDIGTYYTCNHGCIYCYANRNNKMITTEIDSKSLWLSNKKLMVD